MSVLETSVAVNLTGNLQRQARQYDRSLGNFSRNGKRHLSRLSRTVNTMGTAVTRLGNRYVALATGAAGVMAIRSTASLEERFERLGVQANKSSADMAVLRQEIFDTARSPDIKVDPSLITAAIEEIVEKTGDFDFAIENIKNIGTVIQATGDKTGVAIGGILAEFQKMKITAPDEVLKVLDTLNQQGKEGAFTLADLARLGPRVVTAYTATGRTGTEALKEMGAALQVIRMGTGSAEMAATAFEATLRTLADPEKLKKLQGAGIKVFDPVELEKGRRIMRPINELMLEIIEVAKGDKVTLAGVFDAEALRAFNFAASQFLESGKVESMAKFMTIQGDGNTTLADSARLAKTASANWDQLATTWTKTSSDALDPLIKKVGELNDAVGTSGQETLIKTGLAAIVSTAVVGKVLKTRGARKQAAFAAEAATGATPKTPQAPFNVNKALGVRAAKRSSGLLRVAKVAGRVAAPVSAVLTAAEIADVTYERLIKGRALEYQAIEDWNKFIGLFGNSVEKMDQVVERMSNAKGQVDVEIKGAPIKKVKASAEDLELSVSTSVPLS